MTESINRPEDDHADLFEMAARQSSAAVQPENKIDATEMTPELLPQHPENATPETLPVIPLESPIVVDRVENDRPPLMFTERAPIPTRNGEQELQTPDRQSSHASTVPHTKFRPLTLEQLPSDATLGVLLTSARAASGYTLEQVKEMTKIGHNSIVALETDQKKYLPSRVFISAYIRTLCELYRLPRNLSEKAMELQKQAFPENKDISQELLEKLNNDVLVNKEEERRVARIFTCVLISVGIVLLFGIWAIIAGIVSSARKESAPPLEAAQTAELHAAAEQTETAVFDQKQLEALNAEQISNLYTLEMSREPTVRRR